MNTLTAHKIQQLGIAKTWAAQHLVCWDDQMHRDLIARHGARALPDRPNHVTAKSMTLPQLEAALADYAARGWPRQQGKAPAHIKHIVRLWAGLGQAGKVQNASRAAMLRWIERQLGRAVANLDALSTAESQRVIEALKAWGHR